MNGSLSEHDTQARWLQIGLVNETSYCFKRSFRLSVACAIPLVLCCWAQAEAGPAWQLLEDGDPTPGGWSLAYDTARQRLVLLTEAGQHYPPSGHPPGTWELIGEDWVRRFLPEPTPWNSGACMAFDSVRGVTVAFGGFGNDETWEYDGSAWVKRALPVRPSARTGCAMVYDAARGRMVLFGGRDLPGASFGDTWEYDGVQWTLRSFATAPSPRTHVALAYDSARHVVVLFGGRITNGSFFQDTWEYDGSQWRWITSQTRPALRAGAGMAYDPVRAKTVLFGGYTTVSLYGDTWEWNGTKWTQLNPTTSPSPRRYFRMAWDAARSRLVGFGGDPDDQSANDTWEFNGQTWASIAVVSGRPAVRSQYGLTYDPVRDELVLYGGWNHFQDQSYYQDTWRRSEIGWLLDTGAGTTTTTSSTPLTFRPATQTVLGFSGHPAVGVFPAPPDIHELVGTGEEQHTWQSGSFCCPQPDGRVQHSVTYAASLGGLFVFGGRACCFGSAYYIAGDTWLFADTWQQVTGGAAPSPRWRHSLVYDSLRQRVLMYGGLLGTNEDLKQSDLWSYDAQGWQELSSASPPGGRAAFSLAYDEARDRVVLYGSGTAIDGVTWEYDGQTWQPQPTAFQPDPTRCWIQMAYDSRREVTWLFGGADCKSGTYFNDLWAYGPDPDADGIVGGLDNCGEIANAGQADGDADAAGDACDCAPTDPGSFAAPIEVTGLRADGATPTTISWADQVPIIGSGARYDLVSGGLADLRSTGSFSGASCLANDLTSPSLPDSRTPTPGDGFYYVVRSQNACGTGTYGRESLDPLGTCP